LRWIKGQKNKLPSKDKQDLDALKRYWNDPNLTEDEKFLRDYILNKEYLDKDERYVNFTLFLLYLCLGFVDDILQ